MKPKDLFKLKGFVCAGADTVLFQKDLEDAVVRLDSLRKEIISDKFTFEDAARYVSQDKDTRYNKGFMVNVVNGSTRFEMQDLPQEVSRKIETMKIGDISEPFVMIDQARNKEVVAIVKLSNRIEGHRATLSEDYNLIKEMYENYQKENYNNKKLIEMQNQL